MPDIDLVMVYVPEADQLSADDAQSLAKARDQEAADELRQDWLESDDEL